MVDRESTRRWLRRFGVLSVIVPVVLSVCEVHARYTPRPKRHFLSWESLKRPEQYRRLKRYMVSSRRFDLSRRRIVRVKKSSFWNLRPYQFATPTVDGDKIYVGADAGYFYGIDAKLHSKLWTFRTEGTVQSQASVDGGDVVVADCKGNVYNLDKMAGSERWRTKLDTSIMSRPLIADDRIYVVTMSGRLFALDRSTGVEIWHTDAHERDFGFSVRRQASPVRREGLIFVGTSSGTLIAYREDGGDIAWVRQLGDKRSQFYDVDSRPLVLEDRLYAASADGRLLCMDPKSGRVIWDIEAGGSNDPLYHEGKLFVTGGDTLTALDPSTGRIFWQQEFDEPGISSPAGGEHFIAVVSTKDRLFLIDSETGDIAHVRYVRKGSFGDPVIIHGLLYVLSNSGRLFTFKVNELPPRKALSAKRHRK